MSNDSVLPSWIEVSSLRNCSVTEFKSPRRFDNFSSSHSRSRWEVAQLLLHARYQAKRSYHNESQRHFIHKSFCIDALGGKMCISSLSFCIDVLGGKMCVPSQSCCSYFVWKFDHNNTESTYQNHSVVLQHDFFHRKVVAVTLTSNKNWPNFAKERTAWAATLNHENNNDAQITHKNWLHKHEKFILIYAVLEYFVFHRQHIQHCCFKLKYWSR